MKKSELDEYISQVQGLLDKRESEPGMAYFRIEYDGEDFCYECITKQYSPEDRNETWEGGGIFESDGTVHCETCGQLLQYTLTDYGVTAELVHFTEYPFDWNDSSQCYEMARIAYGVFTDQQKRLFAKVIKRSLNYPAVETVQVKE